MAVSARKIGTLAMGFIIAKIEASAEISKTIITLSPSESNFNLVSKEVYQFNKVVYFFWHNLFDG